MQNTIIPGDIIVFQTTRDVGSAALDTGKQVIANIMFRNKLSYRPPSKENRVALAVKPATERDRSVHVAVCMLPSCDVDAVDVHTSDPANAYIRIFRLNIPDKALQAKLLDIVVPLAKKVASLRAVPQTDFWEDVGRARFWEWCFNPTSQAVLASYEPYLPLLRLLNGKITPAAEDAARRSMEQCTDTGFVFLMWQLAAHSIDGIDLVMDIMPMIASRCGATHLYALRGEVFENYQVNNGTWKLVSGGLLVHSTLDNIYRHAARAVVGPSGAVSKRISGHRISR